MRLESLLEPLRKGMELSDSLLTFLFLYCGNSCLFFFTFCFYHCFADGRIMIPAFEDFVTFIGFKELICPECMEKEDLAYKTKCVDTRHYYDDKLGQPIVRRRHICPNCDTQFYTIESLEH